MISISESKIVGTASDSEWSQVHIFIPAKEKLASHGVLLLVMSIKVESKDEEEYDLANYGKELIQRFHEEYYGTESTSSLHKKLVEVMVKLDKEFVEIEKNIIAGVVDAEDNVEGQVYLYVVTNDRRCRANLMRNGKVYSFEWGSSNEEKISGGVLAVSGKVESGDMLILGTYDLFSSFSSEILEQALLTLDVSEAQGIISPLVHERGGNSRAAGIIVKFRKSEEEYGSVNGDNEEKHRDFGIKESQSVVFMIRSALGLLRNSSIVGRILPSRIRLKGEEIVVKEDNGKKRKMMYSVAFVLLVMLGVSIFFGYRKRIEQERNERFGSVWDIVDHQYEEAKALTDLNPLRAKGLLVEAKDLIEETKNKDSDKLSNQQLKKLEDKLNETMELLNRVSGEYRVEEASVFLDLSLVRPNTFGEKMDIHGKTLVVLDPSAKALLSINIDSKASEIIGGGQFFSGVSLASIYTERAFVVSDSGIVEIAVKGKASKLAVEKDPEWGEIVDMAVFGGNLYLLDKGQEEIFRYQVSEGGFDSRQRWLGEGVFPDLSQAKSLAIDGDVWVLSGDNILRFRRGVQENYILSGLDVLLTGATSIYTDSDSLNVYVLDKGNRRVVVFDKNGEYQEQYLWNGIETVSDMVVSEEQGKILLLSAAEIYEVELK